jgi:hypothetical protein
VLDGKTWRWFEVRLLGLPADARLWRILYPDGEKDDDGDTLEDVDSFLGDAVK